MLLQHLRQIANDAHRHTSFTPEKRGEQMIQCYSEELAADLPLVEELGGDPTAYREKYETLFKAWMYAKSRCASTMITGGSGFNVRRNEKANTSERKRADEFTGWRERYFERLRKAKRKEERENSDPLADMRAKLAQAQKTQEMMVAANKIIRKKIGDAEKVALLVELGMSEVFSLKLLEPGQFGGIGFPSFRLTNNNANIKRMQQRVAELEKKTTAQSKTIEKPGGIAIEENTDLDRLQIFFPGKPEPEMIAKLKSRGFKWSPKNGCWQRQLTDNARWALKHIFPA